MQSTPEGRAVLLFVYGGALVLMIACLLSVSLDRFDLRVACRRFCTLQSRVYVLGRVCGRAESADSDRVLQTRPAESVSADLTSFFD